MTSLGAGAPPILVVDDATKRFGAVAACDGVSLDLRPGEIHALIGPNGAGKSTLIRLIAGEMRPDGGAVRFDGADISALSVAERARLGLARSFQISSVAPELSARQNVMLAIVGRTRTAFRLFGAARRDAALTDAAERLLDRVGLGAEARKSAASLAHGQRRQLEMAMALALEPKAFLLDEPMAGLGAAGSKTLTALLDGLRQDAPILLIEHDMDAVFALADRISVLVYGRIIATGRPDDIRADTAVREAYLGAAPPAASLGEA